jgi:hypothetical protein
MHELRNRIPGGPLMTTCPKCGKVLYARYDLDAARGR